MNGLLETVEEIRRMSSAELSTLGNDSLIHRLREQAEEARMKHGSLSAGNIETFLSDRDCVRYPTRLVLEYGEMGLHQFAQPELDYRNMNEGGRILYLRPILGRRPDLIALAVSYMIPVINYGTVITDEHCLAYGAALQAMHGEGYYRSICGLADFVGAEARSRGEAEPGRVQDRSGCRGGCGCANHG